ncbi:MAG: hypothetical protein DMF03_08450 [Verrucomicrobia bacterium]|nr:MAG: hypothetical protein DMF03_08450 [Verrucomicrobiota bacterium]
MLGIDTLGRSNFWAHFRHSRTRAASGIVVLPLPVRPKKKISTRAEVNRQIFKAAEIAQPQIGQH